MRFSRLLVCAGIGALILAHAADADPFPRRVLTLAALQGYDSVTLSAGGLFILDEQTAGANVTSVWKWNPTCPVGTPDATHLAPSDHAGSTASGCTVKTLPLPDAGGLSSALNSGQIFVGDVSNVAHGVTPWGDCVIDTTGKLICTKSNGSTINSAAFHPASDFLSSLPGNVALIDQNNTFTKAQRSVVGSLSLSGSTATPDFDASQNFTLTLVHASCPCTMANPSTTLVAGQTGVIEVIQSGTGSDTLAWGTQFIAAGGTSTVILSTAAGARDYVSYYVADSTHIVISAGALNATH